MRLITNTRQVDRIKITTLQKLTDLPKIEDRSIALVHNIFYTVPYTYNVIYDKSNLNKGNSISQLKRKNNILNDEEKIKIPEEQQ
eukprot:Pgem_evm2s19991